MKNYKIKYFDKYGEDFVEAFNTLIDYGILGHIMENMMQNKKFKGRNITIDDVKNALVFKNSEETIEYVASNILRYCGATWAWKEKDNVNNDFKTLVENCDDPRLIGLYICVREPENFVGTFIYTMSRDSNIDKLEIVSKEQKEYLEKAKEFDKVVQRFSNKSRILLFQSILGVNLYDLDQAIKHGKNPKIQRTNNQLETLLQAEINKLKISILGNPPDSLKEQPDIRTAIEIEQRYVNEEKRLHQALNNHEKAMNQYIHDKWIDNKCGNKKMVKNKANKTEKI